MAVGNTDQIAEWNGVLGQRWAELQSETAGIVAPFGAAALQLAAPRPGERVVDVGCGCGDTSIELARSVAPAGRVLGVDVSQPMLQVAKARAELAGLAHLSFSEADASDAELPADVDLLFSRFGVMFFAEPAVAFGHLRRALRSGGRCVFVCWRAPRDNNWVMTPLSAARQALGITPAPTDPHAPGPFSFADENRLRSILSDAGFSQIEVQRFDAPVYLGASPRLAAENAVRVGPTGRLVREVGEHCLPEVRDAVERALAACAPSGGRVELGGSTWLVSARNP
ncbi:class I SAM-dependent methyltransferase [Aquabacterium sp.]|uniref:class I SAM-dependent methyltransferase n=1 Tax=Aquabacterium sp. TaxID=1872578 RepID=UPI0035AF6CAE